VSGAAPSPGLAPSEGGPAPISLAPGTEDSGLAAMFAELIQFNLEQHPHKWRDFNKLDTSVSIEAHDAEVTITLAFTRGALVVHAGVYGSPKLRISAESVTVLELAMVKIVRGIPNLLDPGGRRLLAKFFSGGVKIAGMLTQLVPLVRLTRLMSVND
jgi:hypothetical protein